MIGCSERNTAFNENPFQTTYLGQVDKERASKVHKEVEDDCRDLCIDFLQLFSKTSIDVQIQFKA